MLDALWGAWTRGDSIPPGGRGARTERVFLSRVYATVKQSTAIALAALAAGVLVLRECSYRAGQRDAVLRAADDNLNGVVDSLNGVLKRRDYLDSLRADSVSKLTQRVAHIAQRGRFLQRRADSLATLVPPEDTVAQQALAGKDSVIHAQSDIIRQLEALVSLQDRQLAARDSSVQVLREALHRSEELREAWKKRAARRFTCGVGPGLTVSLGGQALGGATIACVVRIG